MAFDWLSVSTQLLHYPEEQKKGWGYVLYLFPKMIDVINTHLKLGLYSECASKLAKFPPNKSSTPFADIWAQYDPVIIDDATSFEGASKKLIRSHYQSWIAEQDYGSHGVRLRVCLVIDEESLLAFQNMSSRGDEEELDPTRFLKILNALPEHDNFDSFMGGFMD
ncbi:unnamed protein product [Penicillium manginii]